MSFTDSFWTADYNAGCRVLFEQLYEGAKENDAFVSLVKQRADAEHLYGSQLSGIVPADNNSKRLTNDDYVSTIKNAISRMSENFNQQGAFHLEMHHNINDKVLEPFAKWCREHRERIEYSDSVLTEKYKEFKGSRLSLEKLRKKYFNKCRILEEFKSRYTDDELDDYKNTSLVEEEDEDDFTIKFYKLGELSYDTTNLKKLLKDMINGIELKNHKVAILGTYNNVSTGSSITQWLLDNVSELDRNIIKAESFGQDLVNNEFIRLIGTINNNKAFINSSQFFYQWKPRAFEFINLDIGDLSRSSTLQKNQISDYFEDMKQAIGVNTVDFNDKAQYFKISQEVEELDAHYYAAALELDRLRCEFEELIMDHLTFMEKCEFDRLKAIKKVLFDFLGIFKAFFHNNKAFLEELLILEETINPASDLKFLIENFKVGKFKPNVILYDNYYKSNIKQTFGVDLATKSRLDKKIVPLIIQCILSHLDKVYPDLVNDEERINLWIKPVQLSNIHALRFQLNTLETAEEINIALKNQHPMIITNLLKLYLLELPDSVVSNTYYEIIKSLYQNYPVNTQNEKIDDSRINGIQNVLTELPKCNLATLDALLTHLNRLVQIIGKKNPDLAIEFRTKLSKEFSSILLIPKNHEHFLNDNFQLHFISDLFTHKEQIFKELRRHNSSHESNSRHSSKKSRRSKNPLNEDIAQAPLPSLPKSPLPSLPKSPVSAASAALEQTSLKDTSNGTPSKSASTESFETGEPEIPYTPKTTYSQPSLKRSTSPNKKSLNTLLDQPRNVVSSTPSKNDIDLSEFSQPKFASSLGRKTSVKDLASKFDSPSPSPSPSPTPKASTPFTK